MKTMEFILENLWSEVYFLSGVIARPKVYYSSPFIFLKLHLLKLLFALYGSNRIANRKLNKHMSSEFPLCALKEC